MIPGIVAQASSGASLYTPADFMAVAPTALLALRKLNPAYMGNCLKVRRSTDNTTLDIGFDGNECDFAALLAFCGAGNGFVDTWYDQSGNANNVTQATTALQPRIVNGGVLDSANGYPAIYFQESGSGYYFNVPFHFLQTAQTIVFSAHRLSAVQTAYTGFIGTQRSSRMGLGLSNSGHCNIQQLGSADKSFWDEAGGNANTSNKWIVQGWATRFGQGGNGIIDVTNTLNGSHGVCLAMGGMGGSPSASYIYSSAFRGYMREMVVYPSFLTTEYRKSLEQDLCVYSGVSFRMPYVAQSDAYGVADLDVVLATRKVIPEYNGPCITVNTSSGFYNIGFDAFGELDTTALAAAASTGDATVMVWHNQLGDGNSPSVDDSGPRIVIGGTLQTIGGKPAIVGGDGRSLNSGWGFITSPFTYAAAFVSTSTAYRSLFSHTMSSAQMGIGMQTTDGQQALMCNGVTHSVNGVTTATNTPYVHTYRASVGYSSGNFTLTPTQNGPDKPTLTTNFSSRTGYRNHCRHWDTVSSANDFFQGPIGEIVIAERELNSTDLYAVQNSIGARFGITIT